jgi:hypothetical protein
MLTGPTKRIDLPRSARSGPDYAASLWSIATDLTAAPGLDAL